MATVGKLLEKKGHQVWSAPPDATVYDALRLLAERDIGALLVIKGEELVGILSERDYARKVILQGKASMHTRVDEIMTARVLVVRPENSLQEAMAIMTEKHLRHLPVAGMVRALVSTPRTTSPMHAASLYAAMTT